MPVIGRIFGGLDFSGYFLRMGPVPASYKGSPDSYADLKKAGVPLIGWGEFVTVSLQFLIVAFVVFLIVRAVSRAVPKPEVVAAPESPEVVLLREIRDALIGGGSSTGVERLPLDGQ